MLKSGSCLLCLAFAIILSFYNLGIVHLRIGKNEEALAYFDKALSENTALQSMHSSGVSSSSATAVVVRLHHAVHQGAQVDASGHVHHTALEQREPDPLRRRRTGEADLTVPANIRNIRNAIHSTF